MSDTNVTKKLGVSSIVLMIFSVIFGFTNPATAFFKMGYASIIWYAFGAITFFLPLMFVSAEFAVSFKNESGGGIYTWMSKSRGELYGFVGSFMWYFAIIIWLMGISARIWVPLSSLIFGADKTKEWSILGLNNTATLGVLGIILIITVTFFASKGFKNVSTIARIGGVACTLINILVYVVSLTILVLNKGFFSEPVKGLSSFVVSPNANDTPITLFAFVTYAIFAYGGIEGLGSLVEKAKSAKTFSKACLIGTLFIGCGYCITIFLWGISANYNDIQSKVHMGNVLYVLMQNLGYKLGIALGLSQQMAINIGGIFMRIIGFSMFLSFCGALFTLIYSPIKTLIDGAPKGLWPDSLTEKNSADMPYKFMWIQATIVCLLVAIMSFFGKAMGTFFDILQLLSNVAQCIPYIFIIAAFPAFRRNDDLNHEYTVFKSKTTAILVSTASFIIITLANIFTIFEPVLTNKENAVFNTCCMLIFPIVFFIIAFVIFNLYKKRVQNNN